MGDGERGAAVAGEPMMDAERRSALMRFASALIDQEAARIIVEPNEPREGFWFGGGNMIERDGVFHLCGRYRDFGDSRTGLGKGVRGLELALFTSTDRGQTFEKSASFSKRDLSHGNREVLSIEGCALMPVRDGIELYVSSEKGGIPYPEGLEGFLKPGTGVWTIDRMTASRIGGLSPERIEPLVSGSDPAYYHVKDPFVRRDGEKTTLFFCTHPFSWSSSNTAYASRVSDDAPYGRPVWDFFPRGAAWDVAMTRGTSVLSVPRMGLFAEGPDVSLMFYDGGESVRNLEEHAIAVKRPRGYSCEEIGGLAYFPSGEYHRIERISANFPAFVSPYGTGCSRYVDVLAAAEGWYATWQQSRPDRSQPLVMHFLGRDEGERLLSRV